MVIGGLPDSVSVSLDMSTLRAAPTRSYDPKLNFCKCNGLNKHKRLWRFRHALQDMEEKLCG